MGEGGGSVSKQHTKYVNKAMVKAEMLLKIIITPQDSLLESYKALASGGSEADFQRVLELKVSSPTHKKNTQITTHTGHEERRHLYGLCKILEKELDRKY